MSSASKVSAMSPFSSKTTSMCFDGCRSVTSQFALPSSFMSMNIGLANRVRLTASLGSWAWSLKLRGRLV